MKNVISDYYVHESPAQLAKRTPDVRFLCLASDFYAISSRAAKDKEKEF